MCKIRTRAEAILLAERFRGPEGSLPRLKLGGFHLRQGGSLPRTRSPGLPPGKIELYWKRRAGPEVPGPKLLKPGLIPAAACAGAEEHTAHLQSPCQRACRTIPQDP